MAGAQRAVKLDKRVLERLQRKAPYVADRIIRRLAMASLAYVTDELLGHGEQYRPYPRGSKVHWSSMPGLPPNIDTGALKASMNVQPLAPGVYALRDGVEYGVWLEYGTTRMAARPFMLPMIEWAEEQIKTMDWMWE